MIAVEDMWPEAYGITCGLGECKFDPSTAIKEITQIADGPIKEIRMSKQDLHGGSPATCPSPVDYRFAYTKEDVEDTVSNIYVGRMDEERVLIPISNRTAISF